MVEAETELISHVFQGFLGVALVRQQGVSRLNFHQPCRIPVAFAPRFQQRFGFVELFDIEEVQPVIVVEIVGTGDQLLQDSGAVFRECKIFDKADIATVGERRCE